MLVPGLRGHGTRLPFAILFCPVGAPGPGISDRTQDKSRATTLSGRTFPSTNSRTQAKARATTVGRKINLALLLFRTHASFGRLRTSKSRANSMILSELFLWHVRECLGVPFVRCGRDRARGLDCVGIIHYGLSEAGIVHDDARYALTGGADLYPLLVGCLESCFVRVDPPFQPGDVLAYRHPRCPGHALVFSHEVCGERKFIECVPGRGVQERSIDTDWRVRIEGVKGEWSVWRLDMDSGLFGFGP